MFITLKKNPTSIERIIRREDIAVYFGDKMLKANSLKIELDVKGPLIYTITLFEDYFSVNDETGEITFTDGTPLHSCKSYKKIIDYDAAGKIFKENTTQYVLEIYSCILKGFDSKQLEEAK